jgi:hypothetical protein
MFRSFLIVLIFFNSIHIFAQNYPPQGVIILDKDTTNKKESVLRPNIEFGSIFIKNKELQNLYLTKSMFYWGAGFNLNHPLTSNFYPYILYSQVRYRMFDTLHNINSFNMNQISVGFVLRIYKMTRTSTIGKIGYTHSFINESHYKINNQAYGFKIGLGFEKRILKKSKFYIEYYYNFQKTDVSNFRNFDQNIISIGFCY